MSFRKLPEEERRSLNISVAVTRHEHFLLRCTAGRLNMNMAEAVRRLIEEDNERHHCDLIEPEWARPRNQVAAVAE